MKKVLLPLFALLVLSACDRGAAPAEAPSAATAPAATDTASVDEPVQPAIQPGKPLPQALPEGVELGFPYHFRSQQVTVNAAGRHHLRVTLEFLGGDVPSVTRQLIADMTASGFRVAEDETTADGRRLLLFRKGGYGAVRSQVAPTGDRTLRDPQAEGTVYLVWPHDGPADPLPAAANG